MTLIYSVILCLLFKVRSCQPQCVKETLNEKEFSINLTTPIEVESGDCIWIEYGFSFPTNKVTLPYRKIWFKGDPQNTEKITIVDRKESETGQRLKLEALPRGEYEYGFKLEWGCNQTYIFPKRVRITVTELTQKPRVRVPPLIEGQAATLECYAPRLCSEAVDMTWKWTKTDGSTTILDDSDDHFYRDYHYFGGRYYFTLFPHRLSLTPTVDHHNTNITCVATFQSMVVERTVTLAVKFAPTILNTSQCTVYGKRLVCVCISRGNPPPPICWPLTFLTDFSVVSSSSSSIQTVTSTLIMPAADHHNISLRCTSSNEMGRAEIEIPVKNYTERTNGLEFDLDGLNSEQKSDAVHIWIIVGVSLCLNLILLIALIICSNKQRCSQQKEPGDDMNTYVSLNLATVDQQIYSVISPPTRHNT